MWVCVSAPLGVSSRPRTTTGTSPSSHSNHNRASFICFCMLCMLPGASLYFLSFTNIHMLTPGKHQKGMYLFLHNFIVSSYCPRSCQKENFIARSPRPCIIHIWLSSHSSTLKDVLVHFIFNHSSQELHLRRKFDGWDHLKEKNYGRRESLALSMHTHIGFF